MAQRPDQKQILPQISLSKEQILKDYKTACMSRELSGLVRKEVLNGRAKFGSGGAGKEIPQLALAHAFRLGDFHSPYYREQTFLLARGLLNPQSYFSFLYGDAENDPFTGGRQMNNCYSNALIDEKGRDNLHLHQDNIASVISPVAGHVGRALGIALASKKYREAPIFRPHNIYSQNGNEVSFCSIGDASTSEGAFFETLNAAAVMQVPLAMFVWDDGYGISVPTKYQTTKGSISEALQGLGKNEAGEGMDIYRFKAWDYPALVEGIKKGVEKIRDSHMPALFHIQECTQPFGHSTSGSHERYKSAERLAWEAEVDGIKSMENWIITSGIASPEELQKLNATAREEAAAGRDLAWDLFQGRNEEHKKELSAIYVKLEAEHPLEDTIERKMHSLDELINPVLSHLLDHALQVKFAGIRLDSAAMKALKEWISEKEALLAERYHTHLYSESGKAAVKVKAVPVRYAPNAPELNGSEILNTYFDGILAKYPNLFAFGEDVGHIGDVNQAFKGLQEKYGEERVFDTGIREWTIVGQAQGMSMRGLRPIAELQYLDYLVYAFSPLTDDLATLRYRSNGQQMAPAIIRTRGHRLEGIWHSGSPIGMLLGSMRGIHVLVPRNMVQAAGMYNTLLASDDPGLMIECLNGYRLKEKLPANLSEFRIPFGQVEILQEGEDLTLVTYGSCVRIAQAGMKLLEEHGISVELIDAQTLLPFDLDHRILESLKKTNRIIFMDEDVPGGATAFMMQEVLEKQGGYRYLDSPPKTLTAAEHRPAFGDDGNYISKPNANDVFRLVWEMMEESGF
ncbi:MAG: thiamine pyrophosphate-dependent enzyme [Bacteroidia bacterium]|nr:thiamine pyrophosphate-dependent enzyme [Bacteroidia bacterium]